MSSQTKLLRNTWWGQLAWVMPDFMYSPSKWPRIKNPMLNDLGRGSKFDATLRPRIKINRQIKNVSVTG